MSYYITCHCVNVRQLIQITIIYGIQSALIIFETIFITMSILGEVKIKNYICDMKLAIKLFYSLLRKGNCEILLVAVDTNKGHVVQLVISNRIQKIRSEGLIVIRLHKTMIKSIELSENEKIRRKNEMSCVRECYLIVHGIKYHF